MTTCERAYTDDEGARVRCAEPATVVLVRDEMPLRYAFACAHHAHHYAASGYVTLRRLLLGVEPERVCPHGSPGCGVQGLLCLPCQQDGIDARNER